MQRFLRRWESFPIVVQIVVAFAVVTAIMLVFHLGPLRQPLGRGISYSIFWSLIGTVAVIGATKAEAVKRRQREEREREDRPDPRRHRVP